MEGKCTQSLPGGQCLTNACGDDKISAIRADCSVEFAQWRMMGLHL